MELTKEDKDQLKDALMKFLEKWLHVQKQRWADDQDKDKTPEQVKCKEQWIPRGLYQGMGMVLSHDPKDEIYIRVIEPLPHAVILQEFANHNELFNERHIMNILTKLGMVADKDA